MTQQIRKATVTACKYKCSCSNIDPLTLTSIRKAPKCPKQHFEMRPVRAELIKGILLVFSSNVATLGTSMMSLLNCKAKIPTNKRPSLKLIDSCAC